MKIINAKIFGKDFKFYDGTLCTNNGKIAETSDNNEVFDAKGLRIIPGLVDIHFHGAVGYDFMDGTNEALEHISSYEASVGVTAICPATMTMPLEDIIKSCSTAKAFKPQDNMAEIVGINMEGPFVSHQKVGAQNPAYLKDPSADFFNEAQKAAGGLIKLLAIAPETPNGIQTIKDLKGKVLCSIAHTTANYDTATKAIEAGATHITHLYNAMPAMVHRDPGPIAAGADAPWCEAEIICDGIHIHPAAVRAAFKMYGDDRMILISDSMMAVGLKDGEYSLGGQKVHVSNRKATLDSGTIAGSATNLYKCMQIAYQDMHLPMETVIKAATYNPARSINVLDKYGTLENGKVASLLLVDDDLNLKKVMVRGKWL